MSRINLSSIAFLVATCVANFGFAASPTLDVAGIKIGLSEDDAVAALKAHNPKLVVDQTPHQLQGLPDPVKPSVVGNATPTDQLAGETVNMVFTMAPSPERLWGIQRMTSYPAANRPSTEATLEALRKKYGPENVPNNQSGLQTVNIAWVFDAQGKLMEPAAAKQRYQHCQGPLQGHFGQNDMPSLNDIQVGISPDKADCSSIVLITANIQSTQNLDVKAPFVVVNLTVAINDGRMYGPAIEATRGKVLGADKLRRDREAEEIKKRGAPGL